MKKILLTGVAGFIGWKTAELLLEDGYYVIGMDNVNDYYDTRLKEWRLATLEGRDNFEFVRGDIEDLSALESIFEANSADSEGGPLYGVINLAARAGVRYSMVDPFVYVNTNVLGITNLLELCQRNSVSRFVLASTSSLYAGQSMPFTEDLPVNEPISVYAASKKGAEALAYSYHHLYGIDTSVVRYFTVYGPAGRPDMSPLRFISWIDRGEPITVYGDGTQRRDFTYVDDIARGTILALEKASGYEVINLGCNRPYLLNEMIELIGGLLGKEVNRIQKPFHRADMDATWADIEKAKRVLEWSPTVSFEEGFEETVRWYLENKEWMRGIKL